MLSKNKKQFSSSSTIEEASPATSVLKESLIVNKASNLLFSSVDQTVYSSSQLHQTDIDDANPWRSIELISISFSVLFFEVSIIIHLHKKKTTRNPKTTRRSAAWSVLRRLIISEKGDELTSCRNDDVSRIRELFSPSKDSFEFFSHSATSFPGKPKN